METLTDREFGELVQFIKQYCGINLSEKRELVLGRLNNYLEQGGFESFSDYFQHVANDFSGEAGAVLVNKLTTNHTYFLREPKHFEYLEKVALPYLAKTEGTRKDLRIWSAGCSTGEEPYTLAMIINSFFGLDKLCWDTKILATDISSAVLTKAQQAAYPNNQLETMPSGWRTRYFQKLNEECSVVSEKIRAEVIFRRLNLMQEAFPFKKGFHIIFCRNVMIYFDADTRRELINRFYDRTEPGGYLFIGHSESLTRGESGYTQVAPAIYRKG